MSCEDLELVAFHFGDVSPEARAAAETHLLGCEKCLKDFLALKRSVETDPELLPRASEAARLKLRRAVAAEIGQRNAPAPWRWWERPLAFATAAAMVALALVGTFRIGTAPGSAPLSVVAARSKPAGSQPLLACDLRVHNGGPKVRNSL